MSKAEVLAELPRLTPEELSEIQSRIEDLAAYGATAGGRIAASRRPRNG